MLPSEGGHCTFPPLEKRHREISEYMRKKYSHASADHVSYERMLCGQGIADIYGALSHSPEDFTPAEISAKALHNQTIGMNHKEYDKFAEETFQIYSQVLGMAAGDFAVHLLSYGGIYLGGGVMGKIMPLVCQKSFTEAFLGKGRFCDVLQTIPVYVMNNTNAVSHGASMYALGKMASLA